jgi:hypothetical protein
MEVYTHYKEWWKNWACPELPSLYWGSTKEEAFEQHIKDLGLYGLMEKLSTWEKLEELLGEVHRN